jgi:hypothetical protein
MEVKAAAAGYYLRVGHISIRTGNRVLLRKNDYLFKCGSCGVYL